MKIRAFLNLPFVLLDQVRHRWILVLFAVFFSIFFVNVFVPFNINRWSNDSGVEEFVHLSGFGIIGGLVLSFSQFVVRRIAGVHHFRIWSFALWFLGELLVMAVLFLMYQSYREIDLYQLLKEVPDSIRYTLLSILIPYSLALLLIAQLVQKSKFRQLKLQVDKPMPESRLWDFPDEKGIVRFSIASDQILYFESADNYMFIFYQAEGKPVKQILRNSLKNIEVLLVNSPMKRCHRSFMVNLQKIELVDYEKAKCWLKLSGVNNPVPVSRKFYPEFKPYIRN